jgi:hypothetical protein
MSEISQAYAQKPQRNCTFMNSASERDLLIPYLCTFMEQLIAELAID